MCDTFVTEITNDDTLDVSEADSFVVKDVLFFVEQVLG